MISQLDTELQQLKSFLSTQKADEDIINNSEISRNKLRQLVNSFEVFRKKLVEMSKNASIDLQTCSNLSFIVSYKELEEIACTANTQANLLSGIRNSINNVINREGHDDIINRLNSILSEFYKMVAGFKNISELQKLSSTTKKDKKKGSANLMIIVFIIAIILLIAGISYYFYTKEEDGETFIFDEPTF